MQTNIGNSLKSEGAMKSWDCDAVLLLGTYLPTYLNPRPGGGLSHLRLDGGQKAAPSCYVSLEN